MVLGVKNLLLTTGSQPQYQHLQCLFINSYSLSISYVLGPLLGPADAVVNNDKSPAIGKPSLVVSKAYETGNSLEVQWLRLHTFISEGTGSIPGWRTKILKAMQCSQKKKKESMWDWSKAESQNFMHWLESLQRVNCKAMCTSSLPEAAYSADVVDMVPLVL